MKNRLRLKPLDRSGIPLAEVLSVHRMFQPRNSLAENLGDGFLMEFNPIYRKIREAYCQLGFSFTQKDPCHYFSFPLMSLDSIFEKGKIPYRNNVDWLSNIARDVPGLTLTEWKRAELQFNYLFHESAHFIAHRQLFGKMKMSRIPPTKASLLKIMVGESFANTVECLSGLYVEGEMGTYFLDANCHFRISEREAKTLKGAQMALGMEKVTKLLFASFLYANYLVKKPNESQIKRILAFAGINEMHSSLINIAFRLSDIFRVNTTPLHLMKLGFLELDSWLQADPLLDLRKAQSKKLFFDLNSLFALIIH